MKPNSGWLDGRFLPRDESRIVSRDEQLHDMIATLIVRIAALETQVTDLRTQLTDLQVDLDVGVNR